MTLITAHSVGILATNAVAMAFWLGYLAWKRSTATGNGPASTQQDKSEIKLRGGLH